MSSQDNKNHWIFQIEQNVTQGIDFARDEEPETNRTGEGTSGFNNGASVPSRLKEHMEEVVLQEPWDQNHTAATRNASGGRKRGRKAPWLLPFF